MRKLLITIMLLFAGVTAVKAQNVTEFLSADVPLYGTEVTGIDSLGTYNTGWFDVSVLDGQTLYLTYLLSAGTGGGVITDDSNRVIIEGRTPYKKGATISYLTTKIDTILVIGNTVATQTTLSLSGYHPEARFRIESITAQTGHNENGRTLALTVYARSKDPVFYNHRHIGNISP